MRVEERAQTFNAKVVWAEAPLDERAAALILRSAPQLSNVALDAQVLAGTQNAHPGPATHHATAKMEHAETACRRGMEACVAQVMAGAPEHNRMYGQRLALEGGVIGSRRCGWGKVLGHL